MGVLEWVPDTVTLGGYLLGHAPNLAEAAHMRLHPHEFTPRRCMDIMVGVKGATPAEKLAKFRLVSDNFSPVLRYFFLEHFPAAQEWLLRRTAYVRSVAVNSMVGFVVGIGDRHCQNIMLDRRSGECVHIDFGITFEQGRLLTTPEQVMHGRTADERARAHAQANRCRWCCRCRCRCRSPGAVPSHAQRDGRVGRARRKRRVQAAVGERAVRYAGAHGRTDYCAGRALRQLVRCWHSAP